MRRIIVSIGMVLFSASVAWAAGKDQAAPEQATDDQYTSEKAESDKLDLVKTKSGSMELVKAHSAKAKKDTATDKASDKKTEKTEEIPASLACPSTLDVAAQTLSKRPANWHYFTDNDAKYSLNAVSVYTLKSDKMIKLDPFNGTETYSQWRLNDNGKEKYYLVCSYANTSLLLKEELAKTLKGCRVDFAPDENNPKGPQIMTKFTCK